MVRVDLFHPWTPSLYGTATYRDILTVCGTATLFSVVMAGITYEVVGLLLAIH